MGMLIGLDALTHAALPLVGLMFRQIDYFMEMQEAYRVWKSSSEADYHTMASVCSEIFKVLGPMPLHGFIPSALASQMLCPEACIGWYNGEQ